MSGIFLSSSVFRDQAYDLRQTVRAAAFYRFAGVQLYLSRDFLSGEFYLKQVRDLASPALLKVLVHLPDDFDESFLPAASILLSHQKEKRLVAHYFPGMEIPSWPGMTWGLENAFSGADEMYFEELDRVVGERKGFLVIDLPRFFALPVARRDGLVNFTRGVLGKMDPDDVLHLIDYPGDDPSRNKWCRLGEGNMGLFAREIGAFAGAIVLEYESLPLALKSREVLEKWRNAKG
jgi:hypothetical protein